MVRYSLPELFTPRPNETPLTTRLEAVEKIDKLLTNVENKKFLKNFEMKKRQVKNYSLMGFLSSLSSNTCKNDKTNWQWLYKGDFTQHKNKVTLEIEAFSKKLITWNLKLMKHWDIKPANNTIENMIFIKDFCNHNNYYPNEYELLLWEYMQKDCTYERRDYIKQIIDV